MLLCVYLKTGAILIAVLGIVGSLSQFGFSTNWIVIVEVIWGLAVSSCLLFGAIKVNASAVLIHLILAMLQIIFLFASGILFLVGGIATYKVSQYDGAIGATLNKGTSGALSTLNKVFKKADLTNQQTDDEEFYQNLFGVLGITLLIGGVCIILYACLQIYFFICIHSFYKKIKKGKITATTTVTTTVKTSSA